MSLPRTLFDKIWDDHVILEEDGVSLLFVGRHLAHDGLYHGCNFLESRGLPVRYPDQLFATPDHGISTSSQAPPRTRSDLPTTVPSTSTLPAAASSAAFVREKPNMREMAASTRSPSRPSGTGRVRISGRVLTRRVCRTGEPVPYEPPGAQSLWTVPSGSRPRKDSSTIRTPPQTIAAP